MIRPVCWRAVMSDKLVWVKRGKWRGPDGPYYVAYLYSRGAEQHYLWIRGTRDRYGAPGRRQYDTEYDVTYYPGDGTYQKVGHKGTLANAKKLAEDYFEKSEKERLTSAATSVKL